MIRDDSRDGIERSILGGILLRNDVLALIPHVETDDFRDPRAQFTWAAMRNLEVARSPIDTITLPAELERMGKLDAVGADFLGGQGDQNSKNFDYRVALSGVGAPSSGSRKSPPTLNRGSCGRCGCSRTTWAGASARPCSNGRDALPPRAGTPCRCRTNPRPSPPS